MALSHVRPLMRVCCFMSCSFWPFGKSHIALLTNKWPLTCVRRFVCIYKWHKCKSLAARLANMACHLSELPHVFFEVWQFFKALIAYFANMWLLACMCLVQTYVPLGVIYFRMPSGMFCKQKASHLCRLMWCFNFLLSEKVFQHLWQRCGLSSVWVFMWSTRCCDLRDEADMFCRRADPCQSGSVGA